MAKSKSTARVNKPKRALPLHQTIATGGSPKNYKGAAKNVK